MVWVLEEDRVSWNDWKQLQVEVDIHRITIMRVLIVGIIFWLVDYSSVWLVSSERGNCESSMGTWIAISNTGITWAENVKVVQEILGIRHLLYLSQIYIVFEFWRVWLRITYIISIYLISLISNLTFSILWLYLFWILISLPGLIIWLPANT